MNWGRKGRFFFLSSEILLFTWNSRTFSCTLDLAAWYSCPGNREHKPCKAVNIYTSQDTSQKQLKKKISRESWPLLLTIYLLFFVSLLLSWLLKKDFTYEGNMQYLTFWVCLILLNIFLQMTRFCSIWRIILYCIFMPYSLSIHLLTSIQAVSTISLCEQWCNKHGYANVSVVCWLEHSQEYTKAWYSWIKR